MWTSRATFQILCGIACSATLTLAPAAAQQAQPAPKHPYGGGTPLDVVMHTKLWTDVPEMRDFVKAARPPEKSLDYIPTAIGTEPKRPPLRSSAQLQQMEDELENAGVRNETAAGVRTRHFQAVSAAKKKPAPPAKTKTVSAR
ncbi:hypothetical protein DES32_3062 [Methylovirgula ligni]|uniref:Uncharacterized protein n=1 Tax=Methylovirgula ligni TaxID=569860 RepID=A0A3D9YNX5_9HYPH|nr:hypothetical protein DES32_3062 [Methylovirgula ligni]